MRPRLFHAMSALCLFAIAAPTPTSGQVACQAGLSFPTPAMDRNPALFNSPSDLRLGVGIDRIVLTSNDKVQLRCRSTGGKLVGTNTLPLRGGDLAGAPARGIASGRMRSPLRIF